MTHVKRLIPLFLLGTLPVQAQVRKDEDVLLFPTIAVVGESSTDVTVKGWIFEPEEGSWWRRVLLKIVARQLGLPRDSPDDATFRERAQMFLVDNERGKKIPVHLGGVWAISESSRANGHFEATLNLPTSDVTRGWLRTHAQAEDGRRFEGRARLIDETGFTVISDIDDTIKVSHVLDKKTLLRKTFLEPFENVEGMAEAYTGWAAAGGTFHYVSGSPWQLYPSLTPWLESVGFPAGSMHLRHFRIKDQSFFDLFKPPFEQKVRTIEGIVTAQPGRPFILVGDSTEVDAEVYGEIARRHPDQIHHIFVRNVEGRFMTPEREAEAFADVPEDRWTVFTDPAVLGELPIP